MLIIKVSLMVLSIHYSQLELLLELQVQVYMHTIFIDFLVKNLKYRNTFLFTDLIGLIATFASFYGDLYLLATIRFVFGLLVGINSSITIQYICQFVPLSRSGFFAGMPLVLMLLGLTFGFVT